MTRVLDRGKQGQGRPPLTSSSFSLILFWPIDSDVPAREK
jgi:hypothetical protein